ncbi:hypothetical protein B0I35DRAFT_408649 [Stachybotrys elegans]|uniref:DUF7053 domain-containing protein n=1 Tax=Stachybotrys elegans TaxID=80388 RepID=A0A8K0STZ2_9HYPO|nr:hypothetical protein B0I35DRAFT_408649 [Stachybotrys elegans]
MSKRTFITNISPLPPGVTRERAIEFLHDHLEMIDLNPLIKERHIIDPPDYAEPEERRCTWYSLTDKISYLPGGVMTGDVTYTCAFHDLPLGIQTHCFAPMGLDIREKWSIGGTLPGEPSAPVELGLGAPATGLYIREDIEMRCNIFMTAFVKKTLQKAHSVLVDRLAYKASLAASDASTPNLTTASASAPSSSIDLNSSPRPSFQSNVTQSSWQSAHSRDDSAASYHSTGNRPYAVPHIARPVAHSAPQPHPNSHPHPQPLQSMPVNRLPAGSWPQQHPPPSQQKEQQPWRASDVPTRSDTVYNGPSKPQDYAQLAGLNPFNEENSHPPPPMPQNIPAHLAAQYRPYRPPTELSAAPPSAINANQQSQRPFVAELE